MARKSKKRERQETDSVNSTIETFDEEGTKKYLNEEEKDTVGESNDNDNLVIDESKRRKKRNLISFTGKNLILRRSGRPTKRSIRLTRDEEEG